VAAYYYLISSLPGHRFEDEPRLTSAFFLAQCRQAMNDGDFQAVSTALLHPDYRGKLPGVHGAYRKWILWDAAFRNEMVLARAGRLGVDSSPHLRPADGAAGMADIVRTIVAMDSPLEAELAFMRTQWNFIDSLRGGDPFTLDSVVIYYLQLQLLERKALFDQERGFGQYKKIYTEILSTAGKRE